MPSSRKNAYVLPPTSLTQRKHFEKHVKPQAEAQKQKQAEAAPVSAPPSVPAARDAPPAKRPKFASGANAVRLG